MLDLFGTAAGKLRHPGTGPTHDLHPGWPESTPTVQLPPAAVLPSGGQLRLRPLLRSDGSEWRRQRIEDEALLRPVEPTQSTSWAEAHSPQAWWNYLIYLWNSARNAQVIPLAIELAGKFVGQLTLGNIQHGSIRDCWIGYWVYSAVQGAGVATAATALGVDHAFSRVGLHRVTATYLEQNPASGRVLEINGFRSEGYFRRNLHIDGAWRDHHFVALVKEDYSSTAVERLRQAGRLV
ncbi:GNAT family N-acetyltransferase [Corynebacterium macginleyi]|uniref:GNAT family N-acetyltransferase n=1 Tax=Corynebacterium macginleyi TaxID=38290 RepID=UPI00190B626A|nr:GNAT family protein [Corynebacterium macginleyi]MBK4141930.1 GNAT family N-acetyltransferase [Corynebacterium macginleyi]